MSRTTKHWWEGESWRWAALSEGGCIDVRMPALEIQPMCWAEGEMIYDNAREDASRQNVAAESGTRCRHQMLYIRRKYLFNCATNPSSPQPEKTATMDVDHSSLALYHSVFPDDKFFPFSKDRTARISRSRSLLDGALFFDLLLSQIAHIGDGKQNSQWSFSS